MISTSIEVQERQLQVGQWAVWCQDWLQYTAGIGAFITTTIPMRSHTKYYNWLTNASGECLHWFFSVKSFFELKTLQTLL